MLITNAHERAERIAQRISEGPPEHLAFTPGARRLAAHVETGGSGPTVTEAEISRAGRQQNNAGRDALTAVDLALVQAAAQRPHALSDLERRTLSDLRRRVDRSHGTASHEGRAALALLDSVLGPSDALDAARSRLGEIDGELSGMPGIGESPLTAGSWAALRRTAELEAERAVRGELDNMRTEIVERYDMIVRQLDRADHTEARIVRARRDAELASLAPGTAREREVRERYETGISRTGNDGERRPNGRPEGPGFRQIRDRLSAEAAQKVTDRRNALLAERHGVLTQFPQLAPAPGTPLPPGTLLPAPVPVAPTGGTAA